MFLWGPEDVVGSNACCCPFVSSWASSNTMTSKLKPRPAESVRVEKASRPPFLNSNHSCAVLLEAAVTRLFMALFAQFGSAGLRPNILRNRLSISQVVE